MAVVEQRHSGHVASRDGWVYDARLSLVVPASTGTTPKTWPVRRLKLETGTRGAEKTTVLSDGKIDLEYLIDDADDFVSINAAGEGSVYLDVYRAATPGELGTAAETRLWGGYALTDFYRRPITNSQNFGLRLAGKAGLNSLKQFDFAPPRSLLDADGRMRVVDGIAYCLSKLRGGMALRVASNLYATTEGGISMTAGQPLAQATFNPYAFYDTESEPPSDAAEYFVGYPTDCRTALKVLCGDEKGAAGLRRVYQQPVGGVASWHVTGVELMGEPGGYDVERYAIAASGLAQHEATEALDPTVTQGEAGFEDFDAGSGPSVEYRAVLSSATVTYAHGPVPNLLGQGALEDFDANGVPLGWGAVNGPQTQEVETIGEDFASTLQMLGIEASPGGFGTQPDPPLGLPHIISDPFDVSESARLQLSMRSAVAFTDEYTGAFVGSDVLAKLPTQYRLMGQSGAVYYLHQDDERGLGDLYDFGPDLNPGWVWKDEIPGSTVGVSTSTAGEAEEHAFALPPMPEEGELQVLLFPPMLGPESTGFWDWVRIDLAGSEERQEALSVEVRLSGRGGEARDETVTRFGDGPTAESIARLTVGGAAPADATEFWRYGYGSSPPENGGAGRPLTEYHAHMLAQQRAEQCHTFSGTLTPEPDQAAAPPMFDSVLADDVARHACVYHSWDFAKAEITGEWTAVRPRDYAGAAPDQQGRVSTQRSGLPQPGGVSAVRDAVARSSYAQRQQQALTALSAQVPAGTVESLPINALTQASAFLRAGDAVTVAGRYGGVEVFEVEATQKAGDTQLDVVAKSVGAAVPAGSVLLPGDGNALSLITQHEDAIVNELIRDGDVVTSLVLDYAGMTLDGERFASAGFDGTFGEDADGLTTIEDPGTQGYALTESGEAAFEGVYSRSFVSGTDLETEDLDERYLNADGDTATSLQVSESLSFGGQASLEASAADVLALLGASGTNDATLRLDHLDVGTISIEGDLDRKSGDVLEVGDRYIELMSDRTGTPSLSAGLSVERGDAPTAYLETDEGSELRFGQRLEGSGFSRFLLDGDNADFASVGAAGDIVAQGKLFSKEGGSFGAVLYHDDASNEVRFAGYHDSTIYDLISASRAGGTITMHHGIDVAGTATLGQQATSTSHAVRADRQLTAGLGLLGGGDLTGNVDMQVAYGAAAHTAVEGDTLLSIVTSSTRPLDVSIEDAALGAGPALMVSAPQDVRESAAPTFAGLTHADGQPLQSDHFQARQQGWQATYAGQFDVRSIFADEMRVRDFIAELYHARAGGQIITKSQGTLANRFTTPAPGASGALHVEDQQGQPGARVFEVGDAILMYVSDRSGGGFLYEEVWLSADSYTDEGDGTQTWGVTRLQDGGTAGLSVYAGAVAVDFGTPGDAVIETTAIGSGAPYTRQARWRDDAGDGIPDRFEIVTYSGDLSGLAKANAQTGGFYADTFRADRDVLIGSLDKAGQYLEAVEDAQGDVTVTLKGVMQIVGGSGIGSLTDAGALATKSSVDYNTGFVTGTPSSLYDINSSEGSKLNGIQTGATAGATWGENLTNQPTDAALLNAQQNWADLDGIPNQLIKGELPPDFPARLYLTSSFMGFWKGNEWGNHMEEDTFNFEKGRIAEGVVVGGQVLSVASFEQRPELLVHFDGDLVDSIDGDTDTPSYSQTDYGLCTGGNVTATLTDRGRFGGGARVESSSTNELASENLLSPHTIFSFGSQTTSPEDYVLRWDMDGSGSNSSYSNSYAAAEGQAWTFSCEHRGASAGLRIEFLDANGDVVGAASAGHASRAYEPLSASDTAPAGTASVRVRVQESGATGASYFRHLQLEQRAKPSGFVDGSRPGGGLPYNVRGGAWDYDFTVALWVKSDYSSGSHGIFGADNSFFVRWVGTDADRMNVRWWDEGGSQKNSYFNAGGTCTDWRHVALSYDASQGIIRLYVDGNKQKTFDSSISAGGTLGLGTILSNGGSSLEGVLDEALVLPYSAPASLIERAAQSNTPVYESPRNTFVGPGQVLTDAIEARHLRADSAMISKLLAEDATITSTLSLGSPATMRLGEGDLRGQGTERGIVVGSDYWMEDKTFSFAGGILSYDLATLSLAGLDADAQGLWANDGGSYAGLMDASNDYAFFAGASGKRGAGANYAVRHDGSGFAGDGFEWDAGGAARLKDLGVAGTLEMGTGGVLQTAGWTASDPLGFHFDGSDGSGSLAGGDLTFSADGDLLLGGGMGVEGGVTLIDAAGDTAASFSGSELSFSGSGASIGAGGVSTGGEALKLGSGQIVDPKTRTSASVGSSADRFLEVKIGGTVYLAKLFEKEAAPTATNAFFSWSDGTNPGVIDFTNSSSGQNLSYSWDFGDGNSSTATNPSHLYRSNGSYTVTLTATGDGGTDTHSTTVTVNTN